MKKVVNVLKIILEGMKYCIIGFMFVVILLYLTRTPRNITPQEKERQFRDSVNKAWVYKTDSIN